MLQHHTAQQMLDEAFAFCIDEEFALEVRRHHGQHVELCFRVLLHVRLVDHAGHQEGPTITMGPRMRDALIQLGPCQDVLRRLARGKLTQEKGLSH